MVDSRSGRDALVIAVDPNQISDFRLVSLTNSKVRSSHRVAVKFMSRLPISLQVILGNLMPESGYQLALVEMPDQRVRVTTVTPTQTHDRNLIPFLVALPPYGIKASLVHQLVAG